MPICRKMEHYDNCVGYCGYCKYLKKVEMERKRNKVVFTWDEVSVLI